VGAPQSPLRTLPVARTVTGETRQAS